jgi:hypothetical protein
MRETVVTSISLPKDQVAELKELSEISGESVSGIISKTMASATAKVKAEGTALDAEEHDAIIHFETVLSEALDNPENLVRREEFDPFEWIKEETDGTVRLLCKDGKGRCKGDLIVWNWNLAEKQLKGAVKDPFGNYGGWQLRQVAFSKLLMSTGIIQKRHSHRRQEPRDHNDSRTWGIVDNYVTLELKLKDSIQSEIQRLFVQTLEKLHGTEQRRENLKARLKDLSLGAEAATVEAD